MVKLLYRLEWIIRKNIICKDGASCCSVSLVVVLSLPGQCCHLVQQLMCAKQIQCAWASCVYKVRSYQNRALLVLFWWQFASHVQYADPGVYVKFKVYFGHTVAVACVHSKLYCQFSQWKCIMSNTNLLLSWFSNCHKSCNFDLKALF